MAAKTKKQLDMEKGIVNGPYLAKVLGVGIGRIRNATKIGRLTCIEGTKKYDLKKALKDWADFNDDNNPNKIRVGRPRKHPKKEPKKKSGNQEPKPNDSSGDGDDLSTGTTLVNAKTHKIVHEAKIKKLELAALEGKLVDKEKVYKQVYELGKKTKASLMAIPSKVMDRCAAINDPYEIEGLLNAEINEALETLASGVKGL